MTLSVIKWCAIDVSDKTENNLLHVVINQWIYCETWGAHIYSNIYDYYHVSRMHMCLICELISRNCCNYILCHVNSILVKHVHDAI